MSHGICCAISTEMEGIMAKVNIRKAAMIGCGFVGSSAAFALMQSGIFSEMVMIDADRARAEGEAERAEPGPSL